jgi:hypothetical protein
VSVTIGPNGKPVKPVKTPCPQCKAGTDKRIDGGGFGSKKIELCGRCGFEFTTEAVSQ